MMSCSCFDDDRVKTNVEETSDEDLMEKKCLIRKVIMMIIMMIN